MDLLIPDHGADEFDPAPDVWVAKAFDELLKTIDLRLRCVWVKIDSTSFANPGRWHIVRFHSNPELTTYWVVQTPEGEYCEPQERHLEALQRMDTWTGRRTYRDFEDGRSAKKKAAAAKFEEKRREFRERLQERLDSLYGSQISVPSIPGVNIERKKRGLLVATKPKGAAPKLERV